MPYQLILATDLDGTFLEGDRVAKSFLYNEVLRLREQVLLVYVTGRPIETVRHFCKNGYLPPAHFIVGDHGTHIVDGATFSPIDELQNPIIQKWNSSHQTIKDLLQNEMGLELQPGHSPYRVAYYYDPHRLQDLTVKKITHAGFDVIQSYDMYLDIVPQGVNKGSTLLNLMQHLHMDTDLIVTCGDSLNDLSLFQTGLKSVAVSNSEPKLLIEIEKLSNVYRSELPGVRGIMDGLRFYEKFHLFQHFAHNDY